MVARGVGAAGYWRQRSLAAKLARRGCRAPPANGHAGGNRHGRFAVAVHASAHNSSGHYPNPSADTFAQVDDTGAFAFSESLAATDDNRGGTAP